MMGKLNRRVAFADAICNAHYNGEGVHPHGEQRFRGIEGTNGVACRACQDFAEKVRAQYERICAQWVIPQ